GAGVRGTVDGRVVSVGSLRLFGELSLVVPPPLRAAAGAAEEEGRTAVLVGWDGEARAALVVADQLKLGAVDAVARLRGLGLRPVLLTGDNSRAALAVASQLGIPPADVFADLTLVSSDPLSIVSAIELARATLTVIRANLAWASGYNLVAIPLAALGYL